MDFRDLAIVIAVKNGAKTIPETLASLASSLGAGAQLYVYDANSTDGTKDVVLAHHPQAHYICENDGGLYFAWNNAIKSVREPFLFLINCDDTLHSVENLHVLVAAMRENERLVVASGKTEMTRGDGAIRYGGSPLMRNWFVTDMPVVTGASIFSVKALRDIHGFDTRYRISSDYDMVLRMVKQHSKSAFVFRDLVIIHFSLGGMSNQLRSRAFSEIRSILRRNFGLPALLPHMLWYIWNGAKRQLLGLYFQSRAK